MISKPKYISRSIWVIDISSVLFVKLYKNKIRNELAIMIAKLNLFKGFLISIYDDIKENIPPILPKFFKENGNWVRLLPGDEGYEDH